MQSGHTASIHAVRSRGQSPDGESGTSHVLFPLTWAVPTASRSWAWSAGGRLHFCRIYPPPPIEPARNLIVVQVWIALRDPAGGLAGQEAPGPCHPSAELTPASIAGHSRGRLGMRGGGGRVRLPRGSGGPAGDRPGGGGWIGHSLKPTTRANWVPRTLTPWAQSHR